MNITSTLRRVSTPMNPRQKSIALTIRNNDKVLLLFATL